MATFINVDYETISLLEQNRRQVDANRISSLEGVEQKRLGDQIQATRQRQRRPVRGRLRPGRREELAATTKPINLIVLELSYDRHDDGEWPPMGPDPRYIQVVWINGELTLFYPPTAPQAPGIYDLSVRDQRSTSINERGVGWGWSAYNNGSIRNQLFWPGENIRNSDWPSLNLDDNKRYDYVAIDLTRQFTPNFYPNTFSWDGNEKTFEIYIYAQIRNEGAINRHYDQAHVFGNRDITPKLSIYPVSVKTGSGYTFGQSYNDFPASLFDLPKLVALGKKNQITIDINTENWVISNRTGIVTPLLATLEIINGKLNNVQVNEPIFSQ
jgi:hypothetical protein